MLACEYLYPGGGTRTSAETTLHDSAAKKHRRAVCLDILLAIDAPRPFQILFKNVDN